MRKKEQELLSCLVQESADFVTSRDLSQRLSLSEKTIRTLIKQLNDSWQDAFCIQGVTGKGYYLDVKDKDVVTGLLTMAGGPPSASTVDERVDYLLRHLLFEQEQFPIEEVLEQLYISRSTLSKLLSRVRLLLADYQLELKTSQKTLTIEGEEKNKRRLIMDYFLSEQVGKPLAGYTEIAHLFTDVDVKELYRSILEVCREENLRLSDFALTNLLVHLCLAMKRLQAGYAVEPCVLGDSAFHRQTETISLKIIQRIVAYTGRELPMAEASYITLHLLGKGMGQLELDGRQEVQEGDLQESLQSLSKRLGVAIDVTDAILLRGLKEHFGPLLLRLSNQISLDNPLYEQIKAEYGELLAATQEIFSRFQLFDGYSISEQEWAYIALHILAAIERQSQQERLKVILVCATGFGSAQVLKNRIAQHFGNRLDLVDCVSFHELADRDLSGIDFLISALDLSQYIYPCPVVQVSVLVTEEDIHRIEQLLGQTYRTSSTTMVSETSPELEQALDLCLSEDRFFVLSQPVSKQEVLELLVASLSEGQEANFQQEMLAQLQIREELGTCVFAEKVAVPHPAISLSKEQEVAIAVVPEPIFWDEVHRGIRVIILISPSKWQNPQIQELTQALPAFIGREDLQDQFLHQPSLSLFKQLLCSK